MKYMLVLLAAMGMAGAASAAPASATDLARVRGAVVSAQFFLTQARFDGWGHGQFWVRTYEVLAQDARAAKKGLAPHAALELPADTGRVVGKAVRDLEFISTQFDGLSGNDGQWEDWATATGNAMKQVGKDLDAALTALPAMDAIAADPAMAKAFARGVAAYASTISAGPDWGGNGANEYWQRTCLLFAATAARASVMLSRMLAFAGGHLPAQVKTDLGTQAAALKAAALKYLNEDGSTQEWLDWSALTGKEMLRISREIDAILQQTW